MAAVLTVLRSVIRAVHTHIVPAVSSVSGTSPLTQEVPCAQNLEFFGWDQTVLIIDLHGRDFIHSVFQVSEGCVWKMVIGHI